MHPSHSPGHSVNISPGPGEVRAICGSDIHGLSVRLPSTRSRLGKGGRGQEVEMKLETVMQNVEEGGRRTEMNGHTESPLGKPREYRLTSINQRGSNLMRNRIAGE